jgi:hypothetical protein
MHELPDMCSAMLYWITEITDLTHKEAYIWMFVIIHPLLTLVLFLIVFRLKASFRVVNDSN